MSATAVATVLAYGTVAGIMVGLEILGRRRPQSASSFGRTLTWAMRRRSTQVGVVFVWWWIGWHLVTLR